MTKISRRQALTGSLALGVAACGESTKSLTAPAQEMGGLFTHGVASGDPFPGGMVLWTRVTPPGDDIPELTVQWQIARDQAFTQILASGDEKARSVDDWRVKVEATGLPAGETLYYRFIAGDVTSPTGRTRTLPEGPLDKLRIAVVSCANWQHGFFNAYDHIVRQDDFDIVLHLGDYLYEYGTKSGGVRAEATGRYHAPGHEMVSLADYRQRHGQYKTDPSLQALHGAYPFICLWDDHEVTNDTWKGGAENHDPSEGDFETRKRHALQAYYEWMPVREPKPGRSREALFNAYTFGDLATLATIETRLTARAKQVEIAAHADMFDTAENISTFKNDILGDETREMLGSEQLDFVTEALKASVDRGEPWQLLGNQILLADMKTPDLTPYVSEEIIASIEPHWAGIRPFVENSAHGLPLYEDSWSGYPAARERLYKQLQAKGVTNLLTLTGDTHEFWACDLSSRDDTHMGVEIGTTSITSETVQDFLGDATQDYALLMTQENSSARYYDPSHHGYIDLTLTPEKAHTRFIGISNVLSRDYEATVVAAFDIKRHKDKLRFTRPRHLGFKQRLLFHFS